MNKTANKNDKLDNAYPTCAVQWLSRLISFDTTSTNSNLALIDDVKHYLDSLGVESVLTFNHDKSKANLWASIGVDGKSCSLGGIVLSGHSDVVPTTGQIWTNDPFVATVCDNKVIGRGACDMKGFIACVLAFVPIALKLAYHQQLRTPVHIALSYDEEIGCLGAPVLLADMARRGIVPDYCVIGEPTMMNVVVAHKGINCYRCTVHGKSVHSSLAPMGINAINYAAKMIAFIEETAESLKKDTQAGFDVPFATVSVGMITGGTAGNIVPDLCQFVFECRHLPYQDITAFTHQICNYAKTLSAQMQALDPDAGIDIQRTVSVPAMGDGGNDAFAALVQSLLPHHLSDCCGEQTNKRYVAYATEAGQFSQANIPTIVCGPGSIAQAHKADEFVTLSQLNLCQEFLIQLFTHKGE